MKLFQPLLDEGFVAKNQSFIAWIPYVIILIFIFRGLASFLSTYFMGWVARNVVMVFRQQMFSHLLKLPTSFYDSATSGELLAKITYNVEQVADACTDALTVLVRETFTAICLLAVMLSISWRLTLLFFFVVPMMAAIMHVVSKRLRKLSSTIQDSVGEVTHVAEEAIEGQKVVKAFGGQAFEEKRFEAATQHNRRQEMKLITTSAASIPLVQLVGAVVLASTVYIATLGPEHILKTEITPGAFAAMITAMIALLKPIRLLTKVNANIQKGIAGAASIFEFLDSKLEVDEGTQTIERSKGSIVFDGVNFEYETRKGEKTISDISFEVRPSETVAIVGRSGSGKSTLVSLLPRFYECFGDIKIDGQNIRDLSLASLRSQISIVSQQVTLFNDTIFNNIAYGLEQVSTENVMAAAKSANAYEFIKELPEGFQTVVGENGVRLSGGQKQRIAIARAILKQAPILVLDEATSALDTESERKIQEALDKLMSQCTTLVIAHRLSTIEKADRIIVMDQGRIIESGNHHSLMKENGIYATLRQMQYQDKVVA